MNDADECFSESTLTAIASGGLDDRQLRHCELHFERCTSCCEHLEALSASAHTWESVRRFLPDDDFDEERFTCNGPAGRHMTDDCGELLRLLAPTDDPHMLGRLGAYEISGIIGAGGMGIVLKALEPALARFVALKVLAPRFWRDPQARERFAREARAAASIVHENVIEIYGVAEFNGIPYFTMPYLRGDSLQKRIDRQGPLHVDEILRVAMQVASGLAAAHAQGLVHRDVTPSNILLGNGAERVRLTDFGIVYVGTDPRITQTGLITGTPRYMSPEQVRGEAVDGRSDLFSLGSVIYAMCTGRPPFESGSSYQLLNQIVTAEPPRIEEINPSIPSWLGAIVAKLHAPSPANRFQSAKELATQLEQCLASIQQPATIPPPRSVTRLDAKYRRRRQSHVRPLFLGGLLMVGLMIVGIAFLGNEFAASLVPTSAESIDVRGRLVDDQGNGVADTRILAVQKTWPNDRYQQQMLRTTTDKDGNFVFKDFAQPGKQYAFLLAVISDKWLMTSEYRVVRDGKQQDSVTLKTEKSQPVTIQFRDAGGKPVPKVRSLPSRRISKDGTEHLSYPQQAWNSGAPADEKGEVRFGSWKPGERGAIVVLVNDQLKTLDFTVPENRVVSLTVDALAAKPAPGPPIHVAGQVVDSSGKPVAKVAVMAIQKTWPNNRYRQQALSTTTDDNGRFRFDKFASGGSQYAYLLTVATKGYLMTSEYQVVSDGSQKEMVTLKLDKAEPVTFVLKDANGSPLDGVEVSPSERTVDESTSYLNYPMHMSTAGKRSDEHGEVSFTAWKPGESGSVYYRFQQKIGEFKFKVGGDRRVTITLPQPR
jgi:serine/threonine protein kinase